MGSDMLWYRGQVQEVTGGYVKVRIEILPVDGLYDDHGLRR